MCTGACESAWVCACAHVIASTLLLCACIYADVRSLMWGRICVSTGEYECADECSWIKEDLKIWPSLLENHRTLYCFEVYGIIHVKQAFLSEFLNFFTNLILIGIFAYIFLIAEYYYYSLYTVYSTTVYTVFAIYQAVIIIVISFYLYFQTNSIC